MCGIFGCIGRISKKVHIFVIAGFYMDNAGSVFLEKSYAAVKTICALSTTNHKMLER